MRFTGQLLLPGESGPGLKVNLDVAEHHLAVESDGGGLGAWPLEVVDVERLQSDLFGLTVAGEALRFIADDTIAFTYSGVPAIERAVRASRSRSGVRTMIGRLWKSPDESARHGNVGTLPVGEPRPVDDPSPNADIPESIGDWGQPQLRQEFVVDASVTPKPIQPPSGPAPTTVDAEPRTAGHCPGVRSDGRRCESQILTETGYCYPHDPRRAFEDGYQAAQEARAQLKKDATARLNRVYGRLDKAMRQVERGELDPDTAIAMAQLARTMCAILEIDEATTGGGSG